MPSRLSDPWFDAYDEANYVEPERAPTSRDSALLWWFFALQLVLVAIAIFAL